MFERYSFVAITTLDLDRARRFWVDALGFQVTEEETGHFFIVDAGGLRLCIDLADDDIHKPGSTDPVIGLKVKSVRNILEDLAKRGHTADRSPAGGANTPSSETRTGAV
jgi:catechol 2,3-dioxygenase-like lactoylglutathione lyase family enzyme